LSEQHHTGEYIAEIVDNFIKKIGIKKVAAVVSDNGSNVTLARKIIHEKHKTIFNISCMAHCLNLISNDIISHIFAKRLLSRVNILYKYFKTSHIGGSLLREAIDFKKIEGGGLKKYVETRWITVYESAQSVVRLRTAFEYVSYLL
jgi:Protein of unknown function (DUF 659)